MRNFCGKMLKFVEQLLISMNFKCPHCGKTLTVTHAELARNGCRVVCPQCLTDFEPDGIDRQAIARMAKPAAPKAPKRAAPKPAFCHECGQPLPASGLRYCPYCGHSLLALDEAAQQPPEPPVAPQPEQPVPPEAEPRRPLYIPLRPAGEPRRYIDGPASVAFRIVACVLIAVLAAAFVALVWASART